MQKKKMYKIFHWDFSVDDDYTCETSHSLKTHKCTREDGGTSWNRLLVPVHNIMRTKKCLWQNWLEKSTWFCKVQGMKQCNESKHCHTIGIYIGHSKKSKQSRTLHDQKWARVGTYCYRDAVLHPFPPPLESTPLHCPFLSFPLHSKFSQRAY